MMDQAPNLTDVVVLASDHSMNGSVDLHDQRLSDFLNDARQVCPRGRPMIPDGVRR